MSEHICEENIEENYENFDVIENDIMKARPQAISTNQHQQFPPRDDRSIMEKFQEKFFNQHESKVALNSDVDLIKTTKVPFLKQEAGEDDKVSGTLTDFACLNRSFMDSHFSCSIIWHLGPSQH